MKVIMKRIKKPDTGTDSLLRLKREIALNREFTGLNEAAFLSLVWTWQRLEKAGRQFFPAFGLTDAQFNVLMILWDYRDRTLRQHELADILVVNRASMGGVLERMERNGLVLRTTDPVDRRAIHASLSEAGVRKLNVVREPYYQLLSTIFPLADEADQRSLILLFDKVRSRLDQLPAGELNASTTSTTTR